MTASWISRSRSTRDSNTFSEPSGNATAVDSIARSVLVDAQASSFDTFASNIIISSLKPSASTKFFSKTAVWRFVLASRSLDWSSVRVGYSFLNTSVCSNDTCSSDASLKSFESIADLIFMLKSDNSISNSVLELNKFTCL